MVAWLSVLIFIAGIMIYIMLPPRNDIYQQDLYQQEGKVATFVNQHQTAKDLMQLRIMWNTSEPGGIYALPYVDLGNLVPDVMNNAAFANNNAPPAQNEGAPVPQANTGGVDDIYHIGQTASLNPDPSVPGSKGHYTSAIVCLTDCTDSSGDCINGKQLTICPSSEQYVITYGYIPGWWTLGANRQSAWRKNQTQAWFKAILKRSHGSVGCGLLAHRGDDLYSLDNSQKYVGYQVVDEKRVVPPALTEKLKDDIHLNTCEKVPCFDPLQDLMFCITPFVNPYLDVPQFWWDSLNNTGTGVDTDIRGTPLQGRILEDSVQDWTTLASYTIMGTVSPGAGGNPTQDLFRLNSDAVLREACGNESCSLSVHGAGEDPLTVEHIPKNREYAFVYAVSGTKQTLTVYYTNASSFTNESATANTAGPVLSDPTFLDTDLFRNRLDAGGNVDMSARPYLKSIRIYSGRLGTRQINHNIKADKKRFGL